jgi:hypothetical protein
MAHNSLIACINAGDGKFPFVNVQFSDLVVARPFPSAFTTIAFGYSRRRWFETCSCKPVPRGLPSSVKQLRTTQRFLLSCSWHTLVALPRIEIWADFTCTITALYFQVDYFRARRHSEVEVSPRIGKGLGKPPRNSRQQEHRSSSVGACAH